MYPHGVFIGRFQPFHIGHLSVVQHMLVECETITLVVGSTQESGTERNPWTYEERCEIIRAMLGKMNIRVNIIGLPDTESDEVWFYHLDDIIPQGSRIYTGNPWVRDICEKHGVLYTWIEPTIDISATRIRDMMRRGEDVSEWTVGKSRIKS